MSIYSHLVDIQNLKNKCITNALSNKRESRLVLQAEISNIPSVLKYILACVNCYTSRSVPFCFQSHVVTC